LVDKWGEDEGAGSEGGDLSGGERRGKGEGSGMGLMSDCWLGNRDLGLFNVGMYSLLLSLRRCERCPIFWKDARYADLIKGGRKVIISSSLKPYSELGILLLLSTSRASQYPFA